MKRLALFISLAIMAIACTKTVITPEITCNVDEVTVPVNGTIDEDIFVSFTSNVAWKAAIKENVDWCKVSPAEGEAGDAKLKLIVAETKELDARSATLTITAETAIKEIKIVQGQVDAFELAATEAEVGAEGASIEIKAMTNVDWTVTVPSDCDWVKLADSKAYGEQVKTVVVSAYDALDEEREVTLAIKAANGAEATFYIHQVSPTSTIWYQSVTAYADYTSGAKVKLAKYGDNLLLLSGSKVLVIDPLTGKQTSKIEIPGGLQMQSLCVDEGNHVLVATDANYGETVKVYRVDDINNPVPTEYISYDVANYYGTDAGNIRVKGDITKDAVITACVSDGAGGAMLAWKVVAGELSTWYYSNIPYAASLVAYCCAVPVGKTFEDGFLYIGYGGDYNLYYLANFVADKTDNTWVNTYTTGSSWMENYNCIATAEWKGKKYAAIVKGCHFNYDATDVVLLDITNPAAATEVYAIDCDGMVNRAEDWSNLDWTDAGAHSDVLLAPTDDALLIYYVDANFNVIGCTQYK